MRSPRDFLKPLAIGAPEPLREIPVKPSRCIHFFDPSNEKMAAKLPEVAKKTDILLGNLEDAIPADRKVAARDGLVKIGLARVELIGPDPYWIGGLPKRLYEAYLSDPLHRIPERLPAGIDDRRRNQDSVLAELARRYGMEYASPLQILCNEEGCLTRVGDGSNSLTTWDPEHFSAAGSEYVVERFPSAQELRGK